MAERGAGGTGAPSTAGGGSAAEVGGLAVRPVVARIPFLNTQPFYAAWDELPGRSVELVPRRLGEEARAGRVDAGVMASADFFDLEGAFERAGRLGIACRGEVQSVLLLARRPLGALGGARVRLTSESSTSAALVRLLLEVRFGLGGLVFERAAAAAPQHLGADEAWLVIGDAALAARRAAPETVCLDLGEAWAAWTGLPFVYALWAVRTSLPAETRARFAEFLERSLARGERDLEGIGRAYARATAGTLGDAAELARYLSRFTYRLGAAEEEGLDAFRSLLAELAPQAAEP